MGIIKVGAEMKVKEAIKEIKRKIKKQKTHYINLPSFNTYSASAYYFKKYHPVLVLTWTDRIQNSFVYIKVKILFNRIIKISMRTAIREGGKELLVNEKDYRKLYVENALSKYGRTLKDERERTKQVLQEKYKATTEDLKWHFENILRKE